MSKLKILLNSTNLSTLRLTSISFKSQFNSSSSSSSNQSSNFSSTSFHQVWVQKKLHVKLRVDHPELGKSGEVIRVKPGHMRQRLYPSGQALYCAKDRIPFHHLNPINQSNKSRLMIPSPGLSRPIIELMKRLGIKNNLNKQEIKQTEELRELWIHEHNVNQFEGLNQVESFTNLKKPLKSDLIEIPNGLKEHLRLLINSSNDLNPLITFKRIGSNQSKSLYAAIKPEEIIQELILKLNNSFDQLILKELIQIKEIYSVRNHDEKDQIKVKLNGIKIKSLGDYLIKLNLNSNEGFKDEEMFEFLIKVIKD